MPVEIIETADPLTSVAQFRTSYIYEMLVSLHTLVVGQRHSDLATQAHIALDDAFWTELSDLYEPYQNGALFFELPVNYTNHNDVPGFIRYVQEMDAATFIFYFIGRVISIDDLREYQLDPDFIVSRLDDYCDGASHPRYGYTAALRETLKDVRGYQTRLTRLWERYWDPFFSDQSDALPERWSSAISEKSHILARSGGRTLLEHLTHKRSLPNYVPGDLPITEVTYVPVYYATALSYMYYGYGNVTVLFDSEATLARLNEIEERKEQALMITRALSDNTRLSILKLVAQHSSRMHGKKIAEQLDLSPSSVSRQLAQLRDSGLILEERHDDQTVTYRLVKDAIATLPDKILDYLFT